jgi:hypothetical protein
VISLKILYRHLLEGTTGNLHQTKSKAGFRIVLYIYDKFVPKRTRPLTCMLFFILV